MTTPYETVHKYHLEIDDDQMVTLPKYSIVLSVGEQDGQLMMWVRLTPTNPMELMKVSIRGTGHPFVGGEGDYVGTVQMTNGLVWHVFTTARVRR